MVKGEERMREEEGVREKRRGMTEEEVVKQWSPHLGLTGSSHQVHVVLSEGGCLIRQCGLEKQVTVSSLMGG